MIERLQEGGEAAWDEFVRQHAGGTFFHLSGWSTVLRTALGHRTHYLQVVRQGTLAGVLPLTEIKSRLFGHMLISNAFCVAGGPLSVDEEANNELLAAAGSLAVELNVDYVELKDTSVALPGWVARSDLYAGFERGISVDEAQCLTQIPRKQRAVVRKALDAGLTDTIETDTRTVIDLYSRTVRDHGTPVFPRSLFTSLKSVFGSDCDVLTICKNGEPVSSVMSFYFRDKVLPYYTGSLNSARELGANDFMYWRLMRRAVERGYSTFDFGRSKSGTGPFSFKKNWGFPPRPITHQFFLHRKKEMPNLNPTNPKFQLLVDSWRRLPLPVANAIGPFISRNLG
jgi:FemAB-related protein (PEP-CTERM system-associated)